MGSTRHFTSVSLLFSFLLYPPLPWEAKPFTILRHILHLSPLMGRHHNTKSHRRQGGYDVAAAAAAAAPDAPAQTDAHGRSHGRRQHKKDAARRKQEEKYWQSKYAADADEEDRRLEAQLSYMGLHIRDTRGDGNCLFRSGVRELWETPRSAMGAAGPRLGLSPSLSLSHPLSTRSVRRLTAECVFLSCVFNRGCGQGAVGPADGQRQEPWPGAPAGGGLYARKQGRLCSLCARRPRL